MGHVGRTISDADSSAGAGRQPGAKEECASVAGNVPCQWRTVCHVAHRRHCYPRRVDLLPGLKPGANPRTSAAQVGPAFLEKRIRTERTTMTGKKSLWNPAILR